MPLLALQKSPIPTAADLEQRRQLAEERLEEELRGAKAARAEREAALAAEPDAALPKSEMERLREKERREVIHKAQLALLVGGGGCACGGGDVG